MGLEIRDFLDAHEELDNFMKKIDRGIFESDLDNKVDYQEFIKFILSEGEFSDNTRTSGIHRPIELIYYSGKKLVGLLFGQHWNPTYLKVQQKVMQFYETLRASGDTRFEIVYVSLDQSKLHFTDTYRHMQWLAIPFHQRERRFWLAQKFFVTSTPRLVLLDGSGNLISYDVKNDCCDYNNQPWIVMESWMKGQVRETTHAGVSYH